MGWLGIRKGMNTVRTFPSPSEWGWRRHPTGAYAFRTLGKSIDWMATSEGIQWFQGPGPWAPAEHIPLLPSYSLLQTKPWPHPYSHVQLVRLCTLGSNAASLLQQVQGIGQVLLLFPTASVSALGRCPVGHPVIGFSKWSDQQVISPQQQRHL